MVTCSDRHFILSILRHLNPLMKKDGRKNEVAACATEAANACLHARELAATVDGSNWENFAKENNPLSNPKHESCNAIESNVLTCGNSIVLGRKKGKLIEPLNYCPRILFSASTQISLWKLCRCPTCGCYMYIMKRWDLWKTLHGKLMSFAGQSAVCECATTAH